MEKNNESQPTMLPEQRSCFALDFQACTMKEILANLLNLRLVVVQVRLNDFLTGQMMTLRRPVGVPDCARIGLLQGSQLISQGLHRVAAITQQSMTQVQQQKNAALAEFAT